MKTSFWQRWSDSLRSARLTGRVPRGRPRRKRLGLETLEDRALLSITPQMVLDINSGATSSGPSQMVAIGSISYFAADDGVNGLELWKSDGTAAGTVLLADINPGSAGSNPTGSNPNRLLTNVNGTLFFRANDGTHGTELWKSDGTAAGTVLVKDIYPGSASSSPYDLTNVNGTLFFAADDGTHGYQLWKSDGTAAGTVLVKDFNYPNWWSAPAGLTDVNGTLFFSADDGTHGYELWKSDGTSAGTVLVSDLAAHVTGQFLLVDGGADLSRNRPPRP